jgi:hypothetical protein
MSKFTVDQIVLGAFQLVVLGTVLNGVRRDKGWFMPHSALEGSSIKRGETSWKLLDLAFGIVSVNVLQIIVSSDAFPGWNATLAFFDLMAMIYLFFFNGWFRNWTLRVVGLAQSFEEPVR